MEKSQEKQNKNQQNPLGGCCAYPGRGVSGMEQNGFGQLGKTLQIGYILEIESARLMRCEKEEIQG